MQAAVLRILIQNKKTNFKFLIKIYRRKSIMKKAMRNMIIGAAVAAGAIFGTTAAFAAGVAQVNTQGIAFQIPEKIRDLVDVQTEGLEADTIVSVYETASVEAAKALGEKNDGAGWIFSITRVPEAKMAELRCGAMDGMIVFAEDDGFYYVYNHPTDVRVVREKQEDYETGMEQWSMVNDWAGQEVRQEILANNRELDAEFYTNTNLDIHLAQAAYQPGTKYELRSVDFGPDALDPSILHENDFIEELTNDITYEVLPDAKAPDGEYYVLAFNDNGEEVRFDFFKDPASQNLIRETRVVDGEEYVTFYQANFKDADDAGKTATRIVEAWCKATAGAAAGQNFDDYDDFDDDFDDDDEFDD